MDTKTRPGIAVGQVFSSGWPSATESISGAARRTRSPSWVMSPSESASVKVQMARADWSGSRWRRSRLATNVQRGVAMVALVVDCRGGGSSHPRLHPVGRECLSSLSIRSCGIRRRHVAWPLWPYWRSLLNPQAIVAGIRAVAAGGSVPPRPPPRLALKAAVPLPPRRRRPADAAASEADRIRVGLA